METEENKPKRGRPEVSISWPQGEFTAGEAYLLNKDRVSRVSIHNKINRGVEDGDILKVRKSQNKIGRPSFTYALNAPVVAEAAPVPALCPQDNLDF